MRKILRNRIVNIAIKTIIILLLVWAIYAQVFQKEDAGLLWQNFLNHFHQENIPWLIAVIILVPINWGFETLKWQILIKTFLKQSFLKSYKAILGGITISIFTPNRIGEYGGRILFVEAKYNWKAIVATLVGSLGQLLVLLSTGLIGTLYFVYTYVGEELYILQIIFFLGIALVGIMVFGFFNIDLVVNVISRIPQSYKLRRYIRHVNVLRKYSNKDLAHSLLYAFLRYMTYSIQYYLMLKFFGIDVAFFAAITGIATIFFLQTSVPLPPVMGLLTRGQIALYVWGFFTNTNADILGASFGLFIINLVIPALLGMILIVKINVLKTLGYENGNND